MWDAGALAISLPAKELAGARLPGSLFKREHLVSANISDRLWRAIALFDPPSDAPGAKPVYIARPEMFTHGESLAWLYRQLGPIRNHLCISDGSAVRVIPYAHNHVFFYAIGGRADAFALAELERRVPELFFNLETQVNSAFRFRNNGKSFTPKPVCVSGREVTGTNEPKFYKFYLNNNSIDDSARRTLDRGAVEIAGAPFENLIYAPVTEVGLDDAEYIKALASAVARAFFSASEAVVIGLQCGDEAGADLQQGVMSVLTALRSANVLIPSVPAAKVYFATADLTVGQLASLARGTDMWVHDSFDFWRHPPSYFAAFQTLRIAMRRGRHNPAEAPALLSRLCGREVELIWPHRVQPRERSRWGVD